MMEFKPNQSQEGKLENKNEKITRQIRDTISEGGAPCSVSKFKGIFEKAARDNFLEDEAWPYWEKSLRAELQKEGLIEKPAKKIKNSNTTALLFERTKKRMIAESRGRDWAREGEYDGN